MKIRLNESQEELRNDKKEEGLSEEETLKLSIKQCEPVVCNYKS